MSFFTFTQACRSCNARWNASFGIVGTTQIGDSRKTCPKCGDDAVYTVPAAPPSPSQPTTVVHVPVPEGNESRYVKVLREQSVASPSQPVAGERQQGWLIERYCGDGTGKPMYFRLISYSGELAKPIWADDSYAALRFAREEDAVNVARLFPQMCCLARITEHIWLGVEDVTTR